MKKHKLVLLPLAVSLFSVSACSFSGSNSKTDSTSNSLSSVQADTFKIQSDVTEKALQGNSAVIHLSIESGSVLNEHDPQRITWSSDKPDFVTFNLQKSSEVPAGYEWTATFTNVGDYRISASIDGLIAANVLTIVITQTPENVAALLESVLDQSGGLRFGESYDIGLDSTNVSKYSIEGADGVLRLNENGLLEVVGMDASRLAFKENGNLIKQLYFSVGHSILCTNIKNELIELGEIPSQTSKVTNNMLGKVKRLSLSNELKNDVECTAGLKYLTNLEFIDLSNNDLVDVTWLSVCTRLKKVNLSNNRIKNFNQIVDNQDLEYLDVSNNEVNDISKIKFLQKITYLDLSNNRIQDISDVSTCYGLKSLFLNNNNLTVFTDKLSGLENLTELGVGHCNISFRDIISLKYLQNLTYLDVSGTNPDLSSISNMPSLKTLILNDCGLQDKNISLLNTLTNLVELDISENLLDASGYSNALDGSQLINLKTLKIGGNSFNEIPSLASFQSLQALDLTNSFNLTSIESLSNLLLKTLILDDCNSLGQTGFTSTISSLANLEALSVRGGFNYINEELFNYLIGLVDSNSLSLRFIDNEYVTKKTIYNYKSCVFFSLDKLFNVALRENDGSYTLTKIGDSREIILSLVNDNSEITQQDISLNIDKELFKISIYGNEYKSYSLTLNVLDRKESSFTYEIHNFNTKLKTNKPIIKASSGSKLYLNSYGVNNLYGYSFSDNDRVQENPENAAAVLNVYDLYLYQKENSASSKLSIIGGSGQSASKAVNGNGNDYGQTGATGGKGGDGIRCHSFFAYTSGISIKGGQGGIGGESGESKLRGMKMNEKGVKGGQGGEGGSCVIYQAEYQTKYDISLNPGIGGQGGQGGAWGGEPAIGCSQGDQGDSGANGYTVKKI